MVFLHLINMQQRMKMAMMTKAIATAAVIHLTFSPFTVWSAGFGSLRVGTDGTVVVKEVSVGRGRQTFL